MSPNDVSQVAGGFAGSLMLAFVIVLGIAALLMPLYVIAIHGELKKLRKLAEEQRWQASRAAAPPSSYLPPAEDLSGPPKVRMRSNG